MIRPDNRALDQLREIKFTPGFVGCAEGSILVEIGKTRVLCNATIEDKAPKWMEKGKSTGWVTAEYNLLPRSTAQRTKRERSSISGRTQEIQRLIGRSLRGVCDLAALKDKTITIDCDVLEADGGTRTASVVGAFMVLVMALRTIKTEKKVLKSWLAATSVGIYKGTPMLDLCYLEDLEAEVDMNVVMTDGGEFVEIQGTGEESTFSRTQLNSLLELAEIGCKIIIQKQQELLGAALP